MSLRDTLEEAFLEEFSGLNLDSVDNYARENKKEIAFLCDSDYSLNEKIEKLLGDKIIKKVQEDYYPKLLRGRSPASLEYPKYFAYTLQENSFPFDELRKINLGDDFWKNDVIKRYSDGKLLKHVREKLLDISEEHSD